MRLINTSSLELQEFFEEDVEPYAILSHRWTNDELTCKDFIKGRRKQSQGHYKVIEFCNFARARGHAWAWVDTVCIDKRSSAELSEAINSMFSWYANAEECFAYLADVSASAAGGNEDKLMKALVDSEWFDRGWTLQELLAPRQVIFLSRGWKILGRKRRPGPTEFQGPNSRAHLHAEDIQWEVSRKTGIPAEVLRDPSLIKTFSVAQRMSWAAGRRSTRTEDNAYCMLGLFGVNMSLLYGEGKRAFTRLQLEIIRESHDETIFAWLSDDVPDRANGAPPILARSQRDFKRCRNIVRAPPRVRLPWTVTNHGLQLPMPSGGKVDFWKIPQPNRLTNKGEKLDILPISLNCEEVDSKGRRTQCVIYLCRMRCGHLGRIRTYRLDDGLMRAEAWETESVMTNSTSRTSVFAHLTDCEDLVAPGSSNTYHDLDDGLYAIRGKNGLPEHLPPQKVAQPLTTQYMRKEYEGKVVHPDSMSRPASPDLRPRMPMTSKTLEDSMQIRIPRGPVAGGLAVPRPHVRSRSTGEAERAAYGGFGYAGGGAERPMWYDQY